jgi:hypothetical protein
VQGLERLGSKAVIPSLVELLPSADEEVQVALMLALHSLGQPLEPAWLKQHLPGVAAEVSGFESTLIESLARRDPPGTTRLLIDCLVLEDGLPECPANLYLLRCLSRGLTGHRLAAREPVDRWVSASPAEVRADRQSIRALIERLKAWRAGAE